MNETTSKGRRTKKSRILKAAAKVFAANGFRSATMADLAKEAGLGEATIYNHFKNKEEILFDLPGLFLEDFLKLSREQQQGLKDPEERLRKFIWVYLWWSRDNADYLRVFLLEILPHFHYYQSPAWDMQRRLIAEPFSILEAGIQSGRFRAEVEPALFGHVLWGTVQYLYFTRVLFNRPFDVLEEFDALAGIMTAAVVRDVPEPGPAEPDDKRRRILNAAEALFSEKSFHETKVSEIAGRADVAAGGIYDHFQSKEDLLFSLFDQQMQSFTDAFDDIFQPTRASMRLKLALYHFLSWAQDKQPWARIFFRDVFPNPKFYETGRQQAVREYDNRLMEIFRDGAREGAFQPGLPPYLFRAVVMGALDQVITPWAGQNRTESLTAGLDGLHDILMRALAAPKQRTNSGPAVCGPDSAIERG